MKWARQVIIFLVIFLLVGLFMRRGCPSGQQAGPAPGARMVSVSVAGRPTPEEKQLAAASFRVQAEVADTAQARGQGLVGRSGLQPGYGMLYVYAEPQKAKFEWTGMDFAVSDAFLGPDGTILAIHQADAHDQGAYTPEEPAKYVLEVRRGWFQDRGVKAGDRLVLPPDLAESPATQPSPKPTPQTPPAPSEAQ